MSLPTLPPRPDRPGPPGSRRRVLALIAAATSGIALGGCGIGRSPKPTSAPGAFPYEALFAGYAADDEPNGDLAKVTWPDFVTNAGGDVRRLYEFQVINGGLMRYMPCFCGCNAEDGHRSNRDCYIEKVNPDGSVVFDPMAPT